MIDTSTQQCMHYLKACARCSISVRPPPSDPTQTANKKLDTQQNVAETAQ
jgi:hypothetical protein